MNISYKVKDKGLYCILHFLTQRRKCNDQYALSGYGSYISHTWEYPFDLCPGKKKKATNFCYGIRHKVMQKQPDMQADLTLVYFDPGDTLELKEAWMEKLQCRIYGKPQERTQTPGDLKQLMSSLGENYLPFENSSGIILGLKVLISENWKHPV